MIAGCRLQRRNVPRYMADPICAKPKGITLNRSLKITPPSLDPLTPAAMLTLETVVFQPGETVPNNPRLPVLIYRDAVPPIGDTAGAFEDLFGEAGWTHGWRREWHDDFNMDHRYRTTAHEALGIASGRAIIQIGGPDGDHISVVAGDCLVLPAGTGRRKIEASRDFVVVGACPAGQEPDLECGPPTEWQIARIARLPVPKSDPISGETGLLPRIWSRSI
jgi:uncharacterized protein YjlB